MSVLHLTKESFDREVLQSETPVLVDFFATWCGPCKLLSPVIESLAAEHPEIKVCKVDVDEQGELAARFGVMSIPTVIVFRDGKIVATSLGAKSKAALLELVQG